MCSGLVRAFHLGCVHCFWQVASAGGGRRARGVALDNRTVLSNNTFTFNTSGLTGVSCPVLARLHAVCSCILPGCV